MKTALLLAGFVIFITSLSATWIPRYQGLLTDNYGIVTLDDLDEDRQQDAFVSFTGDEIDHYWQCLEPTEYFFDCENLGDINHNYEGTLEHWDIGEPTFWIKAGGQIHNFWTRRNWSIGHCRDMMKDILWVMKDEPVVCISASYLEPDEAGTHWVLDRVKTRKGAWSWFEHPGYNIGLPSEIEGQSED